MSQATRSRVHWARFAAFGRAARRPKVLSDVETRRTGFRPAFSGGAAGPQGRPRRLRTPCGSTPFQLSAAGALALVLVALHTVGALAGEPRWQLDAALSGFGVPNREAVSGQGLALTVRAERALFDGGGYVNVEVGGAWSQAEAPSVGRLAAWLPANPLLGAGAILDVGRARLRLGGRLIVPLALYWEGTIPRNRAADFGYSGAASARGWRDPLSWRQNVAGLAADAAIAVALAPTWDAELAVAPTALVSLNDAPSSLTLAAALELRWRLDPVALVAGWSLFASSVPLENGDRDQHALRVATEVSVAPEHRLRLEVDLNLDGPHGVAAGEAKTTWGVVLGTRSRW